MAGTKKTAVAGESDDFKVGSGNIGWGDSQRTEEHYFNEKGQPVVPNVMDMKPGPDGHFLAG